MKVALYLVLALFSTTAAVEARPNVVASMTQSVVSLDSSGHVKRDAVVPGVPLRPGTVLEYTIVATNTGNSPALSMKPAGKIPFGTIYKPDSASSSVVSAKPEFSIDGGRTWSSSPVLHVKAADGTIASKPAPLAAYTSIRWNDPTLASSSKATFTYEVSVK